MLRALDQPPLKIEVFAQIQVFNWAQNVSNQFWLILVGCNQPILTRIRDERDHARRFYFSFVLQTENVKTCFNLYKYQLCLLEHDIAHSCSSGEKRIVWKWDVGVSIHDWIQHFRPHPSVRITQFPCSCHAKISNGHIFTYTRLSESTSRSNPW